MLLSFLISSGPIGSRYKIDASYLSPHVNLSEALQDLTKLYSTPLLVSGEFFTLLSPYMKSFMRRIDVVKVVGRDVPMNLYAFDIHAGDMRNIIARRTPDGYDTEAEIEVLELKSSYFSKYRAAQRRSNGNRSDDDDEDDDEDEAKTATVDIMDSPLSPGPIRRVRDPLSVHALFSNAYLNPHLSNFGQTEYTVGERMAIHHSTPIATYHLVYNYRLEVLQASIPVAFQELYATGLELYLDGDWPQAKAKMEEARSLYPEDGTTKVILDVMEEHQFVAPPDWAGFHEA